MPILCKQCGFENPDNAEICEICAEPLKEIPLKISPTSVSETETKAESDSNFNSDSEYYIFCPESQTRTLIPDPHAESFFCEGCKIQHPIDGFIWSIEQKKKQKTISEKLILQELKTGFRIELEQSGTLGRYGTYGAEFFWNQNMMTVSGEHCLFLLENHTWTVRHISRTNQTSYDGILLQPDRAYPIKDKKILNLAGTVSFLTILETCT